MKKDHLTEMPRDNGSVLVDPEKTTISNPNKRIQINYWNLLRTISTIGLAIIFLWGSYQMLHTTNVLKVNNEPVPVKQSLLRSGEPIILTIDYCKQDDIVAEVIPMMIGQETYFLPSYISNVQVGCEKNNFTIGNVPLYAQPGIYYIRLIVQYQANGLHKEHFTIESQPFEVTSGKFFYLP